jgi:hypothetical protein
MAGRETATSNQPGRTVLFLDMTDDVRQEVVETFFVVALVQERQVWTGRSRFCAW